MAVLHSPAWRRGGLPSLLALMPVLLLLAACGSAPQAPVPQDPAPPLAPARPADSVPDTLAAFEQQLHAHAQRQLRAACLADAALAYEILSLLQADAETYRKPLAEVKQRIEQRLAETLDRAAQQRKRGELAAAEQSYLEALALQPDHAAAMAALRAMEAQRNRRGAINPSARLLPPPLARAATPAKAAAAPPAKAPAAGPDYEALLARLAAQSGSKSTPAAPPEAEPAAAAACVSYEEWARRRSAP